ncbi:TetR family transcriptional regulator C-terminal domain-containing protein [Amycolatopsis rhabdoformis]|uniref:TetR family transcriptional regulator C-terminal domain-containing protein n=1 Tax=Amycolatopsis rhabdoformis TaxID=1448059 RepID=A0ABZ1HWT1_9PSEU|nr:TetR family transcriptional regulator C-terminal domain-containing protein [Amycolatopsis rhabdoformis]WSE26610.1 TetR family transcriptional regulator C-terminal domain-containing protein [Amycolatopsis rhabdoformis]
MPRQRDVEAQRELLSGAVWQVLAADGLPGLTVRAVAERAGCTTGLVMHAFPTKQALLLRARDLLHQRTAERADATEASGSPPLVVLREVLGHAATLTPEAADEARVWVGFLAAALADPELAERHRAHNRAFIARVTRLVGDCRPRWAHPRRERAAKRLIALVEGLNALTAADPEAYPPAVHREAIATALSEFES